MIRDATEGQGQDRSYSGGGRCLECYEGADIVPTEDGMIITGERLFMGQRSIPLGPHIEYDGNCAALLVQMVELTCNVQKLSIQVLHVVTWKDCSMVKFYWAFRSW